MSSASKLTLENIAVKNNCSPFDSDIVFEITFSTSAQLRYPIGWRIIYVGSASSEDYDQVLEEFEIEPILNTCTNKFQISCPAPKAHLIPKNQILCVTAIIITASYHKQEFVRVGYYVHNQLVEGVSHEEAQHLSLPALVAKIRRTVITDKPRITKFNIEWGEDVEQSSNRRRSQQSLDFYFAKCKKSNKSPKKAISSKEEQYNKSNEKQSTTQQSDSLSMI